MWVLIKALYKRCLGAPGHVTKILQAKNGQIMEILNRYISVITDIDETWFVIFEYTINYLSFGYVRLPQHEYYFSCFFCFILLFFSFFLFFSGYLLLNR